MNEKEKREKVIAAFRNEINKIEYTERRLAENGSAMMPRFKIGAMYDALDLLKYKEPLAVLSVEPASSGQMGYCPKCGTVLLEVYYNPHYCGVCGQAVKW